LASPPRRPITRSQTSHHTQKIRSTTTSVDRELSSPNSPTGEPDRVVPTHTPPPAKPAPLPDVETKPDVYSIPPPPPPPGQYTFLGTTTPLFDRRGPRSRAALPVPVPNLTKKSRGRRVPTIPAAEKEGVQKPGRLYVCKVEDCGKCFNRGEHLKRHIRSIHTHEKPFKCSHPSCDKFFNRHDNLLQHLKVHKNLTDSQDKDDPAQEMRSHTPESEPISTKPVIVHNASPTYNAFPLYPGRSIYTINMAVSSLRTEIPHSPTEPSSSPAQDTIFRSPHHRYDHEPSPTPRLRPLLLPTNAQRDDWQT
jgi:hypothetical protein